MPRSSMFSPGEAFWNGEIEMANDLFSQSDKSSSQFAKETNNLKSQYELKNIENLGNTNVGYKSKEIPDECESIVKLHEVVLLWSHP
ncbi:hypothetical protein V6N12_072053 [Hibiscus sabdariffa]|uniref:Uncharacterized protein n=1 Tax=Hibiscus sabdariffa TaxID=183260 RepID=A0ABR2FLJ5_9ROSI